MTREVKIRLLQKKLTIEQLAILLGKHPAQISHVLCGYRPGKKVRHQIAAILCKPESWLAREIDRAKAHRRNTNPDRAPRGPYPS